MNDDEVAARRALIEIRRLYLRSNKRNKNTCYQMYLVAKEALAEMGAPAAEEDRAANEGRDASRRARWG